MISKCSKYFDEMIETCGVGCLLGLMTGCVAPLYHSITSKEDHDKNGSHEDESQEVNVKISYPHQRQFSNDTSSNTCDRRRNSIDSSDVKEMKRVAQEAKPVSLEEVQIVPVIPPLNRRRTPGRFWSSRLRNQLENITNASSHIYDGSTKVVQAQIEVYPRNNLSTSHEASDSSNYKSIQPDSGSSSEPVNNRNCSNDEKIKKVPSIVRKWRNFKKIFTGTRSVPAAQSTMLQQRSQMNISTSTGISANILETRPLDDSNKHNEFQKENDKEQSCPRTKTLQEMVSPINRQFVDGKSMCDVRINGLTMNQSDLLELFEATEGKTRSVSMMTTEEAQIISIKFYRRRNDNETAQSEDNSEKQSGMTNLAIPPIYVSDYSINETSYRGLPKIRNNATNCPVRREIRR